MGYFATQMTDIAGRPAMGRHRGCDAASWSDPGRARRCPYPPAPCRCLGAGGVRSQSRRNRGCLPSVDPMFAAVAEIFRRARRFRCGAERDGPGRPDRRAADRRCRAARLWCRIASRPWSGGCRAASRRPGLASTIAAPAGCAARIVRRMGTSIMRGCRMEVSEGRHPHPGGPAGGAHGAATRRRPALAGGDGRCGPLLAEYHAVSLEALAVRVVSGAEPRLTDAVIEALLNHETFFYRDFQPFRLLAEQGLGRLHAARRDSKRLRIWSAGCSHGPGGLFAGDDDRRSARSLGRLVDRSRRYRSVHHRHLAGRARGRYSQLEIQRGLPVATMLRRFEPHGDHWHAQESLRARRPASRPTICSTRRRRAGST